MLKTHLNAMKTKEKQLNKPFQLTSVCRADLVMQGYNEEQVLKLTDDEMENIARRMSESFLDMGYWDSLGAMADYYNIKQA